MSSSTHQIKIKAVDKTSAGFNSISAKAKKTGSNISKFIGAGIAAAGAYMGARGITNSINELGSLSDIAQRTSTSVEELTSATQAFNILGIQHMGVEQFAKALDRMQKNTGNQGMSGFYQTIEQLAKIDDIALRTKETMKIFGDESGAFLTPLIEGAKNGSDNLKKVIDLMPKINTSAANAGDSAADAMSNITNALSTSWKNLIGDIVELFDKNFTGGIREASMKAVAYIEYFGKYLKHSFINVSNFFKATQYNIKTGWGYLKSVFTGETYQPTANSIQRQDDNWKQIIHDELTTKLDKIEKTFSKAYSTAAKTPQTGGKNYLPAFEPPIDVDTSIEDALNWLGDIEQQKLNNESKDRIINDLILGGTNEATKLSILGPQMRETEKQTKLLEDIAKNTRNTNDNIKTSSFGKELVFREIN